MFAQYRKQILAGVAVLAVVAAYLVGDVDLATALGQGVSAVTNGF